MSAGGSQQQRAGTSGGFVGAPSAAGTVPLAVPAASCPASASPGGACAEPPEHGAGTRQRRWCSDVLHGVVGRGLRAREVAGESC